MAIDSIYPFSFELNSDCNLQHYINENELNFQYLKSVNYALLHSRFQNTKTVWSLNEKSTENSGRNEKKGNKQETSAEGLTLKELPSHMKYAFLEPEGAKPVIISAALNENEEQQLLRILRNYKEAIAWSIEDLEGINPSICMHKILLNDDLKTSVEHQRRLNPMMEDVVRNEVLKWLNTGFI